MPGLISTMLKWWVTHTTPPHPIGEMSLAQREQIRQHQLLSLILFLSALFGLPFLILQFIFPNIILLFACLYEISAISLIFVNRAGYLQLTAYLYISGNTILCAGPLFAIGSHDTISLLWLWLPLVFPAVLAGLFLSTWSPVIFALIESIIVNGLFLTRYFTDTRNLALSPALATSFLVYTNILIFGLALSSSLYAHNLHKAVSAADRAAELAEAHAKLQVLATTDPITGLLNHRAWNTRFQEVLITASEKRQEFGVIFTDIDHFKQVNDTWGHQVGDIVLAHVAHLLQEHIPDSASVGRYGGEEFVIVCPNQGIAQITALSEQLRSLVEQTPATLADGQRLTITISIGAAHFPTHGDDSQKLLKIADSAMYQAKRTGRNRVCMASSRDREGQVLIYSV